MKKTRYFGILLVVLLILFCLCSCGLMFDIFYPSFDPDSKPKSIKINNAKELSVFCDKIKSESRTYALDLSELKFEDLLLFDSSCWYVDSNYSLPYNVTELILPSKMSKVADGEGNEYDLRLDSLFGLAANLKKITVSESNNYVKVEDNVLYTKDGSRLIVYPARRKGESFTIPETVRGIDNNAFKNTFFLKEIPNFKQLRLDGGIGWSAFEKSSITKIKFPEEINEVSNYTFSLAGLEEIELNSGVTRFGYNGFRGCIALKKIVFHSEFPPEICEANGLNEFDSCNRELKFYVPAGTKENYLNPESSFVLYNYFKDDLENRIIEIE